MRRVWLLLLVALVLTLIIGTVGFAKQKVTLKVISRTWAKEEIEWAWKKLQENHPELDITIEYHLYEYNETRTQLAIRLSRREPIDVMTVDHIWIGEFKDMIMQIDKSKIKGYDDWLPCSRR